MDLSRMGGRAQVSWIKAGGAALVLVCWCVVGALTMVVAKALKSRRTETFPLVFHGFVCRLFSLQCDYIGIPCNDRPVLYVANHASYLDVFVLGKVLRGSFVAKSEVASWPVLGKLARLQNTLFLERRTRRAAEQIAVLREHLQHGNSLIMFPEGTSTCGTRVDAFRSSLFAAADHVTIQPVTVAYVGYEGTPMTQDERDRYAWYLPDPRQPIPNRPFAAHFFAALGLRRCSVKVLFHPPVTLVHGQRKECARSCEGAVRAGLVELLGPVQVAPVELTSAT